MPVWLNIFLMVRSKLNKKIANKYIIKEMIYDDVFGLESIVQLMIKNIKVHIEINTVECAKNKDCVFVMLL